MNPDFGQVEVDPAVVNLSAFETTFQEKRPFFVANSAAFSFGGLNCFFCSNVSSLNVFYSRRIGRSPQLGGLVQSKRRVRRRRRTRRRSSAPRRSPAAPRAGWRWRCSTRSPNRVTARYIASGAPASSPVLAQEVEPLTNYFVGRLRQDFRGGDTRVGDDHARSPTAS